jgi:hypothetical protein
VGVLPISTNRYGVLKDLATGTNDKHQAALSLGTCSDSIRISSNVSTVHHPSIEESHAYVGSRLDDFWRT